MTDRPGGWGGSVSKEGRGKDSKPVNNPYDNINMALKKHKNPQFALASGDLRTDGCNLKCVFGQRIHLAQTVCVRETNM